MPVDSSYATPFGAVPQNPAARLSLRSWCALAIVSGLLIFHQLLLQPALLRMSSDAPVINVAGRQRMLSQKLSKTVLALQTSPDPATRQIWLRELSTVVSEWNRAHRGLQQGDATLQLPGRNSPEIAAAFARLEPHFQAILTAAEELLTTYDPRTELAPPQRAAIQRVLQHEGEFLSQMHALVGLYATSARSHVWQLQVLGWVIVASILAILLAIQWLVIRPAVNFVGNRFAMSEAQYRRLVESMSEGLIVIDAQGQIQFANRRFCELVGTVANDPGVGTDAGGVRPGRPCPAVPSLLGQMAARFVADPDRRHFYQLLSQTVPQLDPVELALRRPDGQFIETMASLQPLYDERGGRQGFLVVLTDITARKHAEQRSRELVEQLVHADRLRSMGELAAGLAHEVNQPLAAIANYAEGGLATLRDETSSPQGLLVPLQRILSAALRGGEIIRRARRYAQRRPHQVQAESLNDLVRDVEQLCRPEGLRRDITVEMNLDPDLPPIQVDGLEVQQVLTNLVQNAFAALELVPAYRRRLRITTEMAAPKLARVLVSDSGLGLDGSDSSRLFEPFVTTRREGLGLGLAIARTIVEAHGGTIQAGGNPDGGATFSFTLPTQPPPSDFAWTSTKGEVAHA